MAVDRGNRINGTTKVIANRNFAQKVEIVAAHICLIVCLFSASSETWIPRASEKASAMAIVRIPASTTIFECVPACKPTIRPRVVMTADVSPKEMPVRKETFICLSSPMFSLGYVGAENIIVCGSKQFFGGHHFGILTSSSSYIPFSAVM